MSRSSMQNKEVRPAKRASFGVIKRPNFPDPVATPILPKCR